MEILPRGSPEGDRQANGQAERAVREIKRQVRVLKSATEARLGRRFQEKDPLLTWLPRHAAELLNRYRVGTDGKTAEKRRCGRNWHKPALALGEKIYVKPAVDKKRKNDLEPKMVEGRYVGHHGRTGAVMVLTEKGVVRGVSFRHQTDAERWSTGFLDEIKGFPWKFKPDDREAGFPAVPLQVGAVPPPIARPTESPPRPQRKMYVLKADIEKHGPTDECVACTRLFLGERSKDPHSDKCRERIQKLMEEDDAGRAHLEEYKWRRAEQEATAEDPEAGPGAQVPDQPMVDTKEGESKDSEGKQVKRPLEDDGFSELADRIKARIRARESQTTGGSSSSSELMLEDSRQASRPAAAGPTGRSWSRTCGSVPPRNRRKIFERQ